MKKGPTAAVVTVLLAGIGIVGVLVTRPDRPPAEAHLPPATRAPSAPATSATADQPPAAGAGAPASTPPAPVASPPGQRAPSSRADPAAPRTRPLPAPAGTMSTGLPTSAPPGDPAVVERALAGHSRAELSLLGALARADVDAPPALKGLFQLHRQGAPPEQLRRYVRTSFPKQIKLRLLTIQWINSLDPARRRPTLPAPAPTGAPLAPLGTIEPSPPRP